MAAGSLTTKLVPLGVRREIAIGRLYFDKTPAITKVAMTSVLVRVEELRVSRLGASPGCPAGNQEPGLASKRLESKRLESKRLIPRKNFAA
jgi:hypothetical protein